MKTEYFKASQGFGSKMMSWAVGIFLFGATAASLAAYFWMRTDEPEGANVILGYALLTGLALPIVALFAPKGFEVGDGYLTVCRAVMPRRIPLQNIKEVKHMNLSRVIRIGGCGGFLGAWGWMRCKELGNFRGYMTQSENLITVFLHEGLPVVLTPDDPNGLQEELKKPHTIDVPATEEIIAAAGSLPEIRYVNLLLYKLSKSAPSSATLSESELPEVIDPESGKPIETDFLHILHRLQAMSPDGGDIQLSMEGNSYTVALDVQKDPEPACTIRLSQ